MSDVEPLVMMPEVMARIRRATGLGIATVEVVNDENGIVIASWEVSRGIALHQEWSPHWDHHRQTIAEKCCAFWMHHRAKPKKPPIGQEPNKLERIEVTDWKPHGRNWLGSLLMDRTCKLVKIEGTSASCEVVSFRIGQRPVFLTNSTLHKNSEPPIMLIGHMIEVETGSEEQPELTLVVEVAS